MWLLTAIIAANAAANTNQISPVCSNLFDVEACFTCCVEKKRSSEEIKAEENADVCQI